MLIMGIKGLDSREILRYVFISHLREPYNYPSKRQGL